MTVGDHFGVRGEGGKKAIFQVLHYGQIKNMIKSAFEAIEKKIEVFLDLMIKIR
jgi:hypothetical protein